jgi:hypothetical protein
MTATWSDFYARRLPLSEICELLGLPLADRPKFTGWAGGLTRFTGAFFLTVVPKIFTMKRYMEECLNATRETGGAGVIAKLVRVEKEGERIKPRRDGGDAVLVAVRRSRNHDSFHQRVRS